MGDFDTAILLHADRAYWNASEGTPLNSQRSLERKWDKIPKGSLDECIAALDAVSTYTSPQAGNKELSGTYRNSGVVAEEKGDWATITQTLSKGWASTGDSTPTPIVVNAEDLAKTPFADEDIVDKHDRVYRYRGIDPAAYDDHAPTVGPPADGDGYTTKQVEARENPDGSIDIFELRRKYVVAAQSPTSGESTKRITVSAPNWSAKQYSIRYWDIDKDQVQTDMDTLSTPPSGYEVGEVSAAHDKEAGTAHLTQTLVKTYTWDESDTERDTQLRFTQPGMDAEVIDVVWHRIKKSDLDAALTYLKTNAAVAGYAITDIGHNDSGVGYADVTQRLHKVSTNEVQRRYDFTGEAVEERVYVLPHRLRSAGAPAHTGAPTGFSLLYKQENEIDEVISTWVFHYRKTHTMGAGDHQAAAFLFVRDNPGEDVERRRRKYFGVEDADLTNVLFTTATSGYQVIDIAKEEQGKGFSDVVVTEVKVYLPADAPEHVISKINGGKASEVRTRRYLNVIETEPATNIVDDSEFTTASSGFSVLKIEAANKGNGYCDVIVTEVNSGSDIATDKYTVSSDFFLHATNAETYDVLYPNWPTDPEDDVAWAEPDNYNLIEKNTTEKGDAVADYRFKWGRVEAAISPGGGEDYTDYGEVIAERSPLHPMGGSTTRIYRNQSWANGLALVQTLKAEANTLDAAARPKPGVRCDVVWEYRVAPGSSYSIKEKFRRQRHAQAPDTDGSDEVTAWKEKIYDETVVDTITYTFYASVSAANTALDAWTPNLAETYRVIPLPDGTAYIEFRDRAVTQNSLTVLWQRSV